MAIEYTTRPDSKVVDTIKLTDNDGYKTFRKLYNHAQMIKKYVKWDNASSHDYGIMRGNMFLFNDNNCKMVASLKMLDSPELSNIPYFLLNADEFFEYEKTGKKTNFMLWQNGNMNLMTVDTATGLCQSNYSTSVAKDYLLNKAKEFNERIKHVPTLMPVISMSSTPREGMIHAPNLLQSIMVLCDLYPCPRIGFSPTHGVVHLDELNPDDPRDQTTIATVKSMLQLPKKFLPKIEPKDQGYIEFKAINEERQVCKIVIENKKYIFTLYMETIFVQ